MAIEIAESREGEVVILGLTGRLDAASSPVVDRKVTNFIEVGARKLVLNFEHVDYLSSAGMRLLLTASKKLQSLGGKLALAAVGPEVMEVIKMAGFDRILDMHNTQQEAIASF